VLQHLRHRPVPRDSPMSNWGEPTIVEFPRIVDPRGSLTFIEGMNHIPFEIKRVYYLYDVPGGASRAGHGHRSLSQIVIAISGSFDIHVETAKSRWSFHLNRSYAGLFLPPRCWRVLDNFSSGSVCMVLASLPYDEGDYLRDYNEFRRFVEGTP
jgi:hypothetical protein